MRRRKWPRLPARSSATSDEDGYLLLSLEELCEFTGCTPEEAGEALAACASDGSGRSGRPGFARVPVRCSWRRWGCKDSLAWKIVQEHLPLLESHKFKEIAADGLLL